MSRYRVCYIHLDGQDYEVSRHPELSLAQMAAANLREKMRLVTTPLPVCVHDSQDEERGDLSLAEIDE